MVFKWDYNGYVARHVALDFFKLTLAARICWHQHDWSSGCNSHHGAGDSLHASCAPGSLTATLKDADIFKQNCSCSCEELYKSLDQKLAILKWPWHIDVERFSAMKKAGIGTFSQPWDSVGRGAIEDGRCEAKKGAQPGNSLCVVIMAGAYT